MNETVGQTIKALIAAHTLASDFNMKPNNHYKPFTTKEIREIKEKYLLGKTAAELGAEYGRTMNSIVCKLGENKIKKTPPEFSNFEDAIVMSSDKPQRIAKLLNRNIKSIYSRRYKLKNLIN